jgi:radical SAM superfamily enzyme YgiQ (UPF0313 family)
MTDVLFTHSYFLRLDPKQWAAMQPYPPLGALYAAAWVRHKGYTVALSDSMLSEGTRDFESALKQRCPRFVVLFEDNFNYLSKMCLTRMREAAYAMIALAGQAGCPVIVCGSDATDHKEDYLRHGADYILIGEGEHTLGELLDGLSGRTATALEDIPGLFFMRDGVPTQTAPRGFLRDLDTLPLPARDLVDMKQYERVWRGRHGFFSMNMVTTRGCPFRCNWCAKPIYGNRYNSHSPERAAAELLHLRETYHTDHIWFADDIFGLKPGWVEAFSRHTHEMGCVTPFRIQARVDLLNEEVVVALKQAGCLMVWVGAESGSQNILNAMDKGTTVEQIYEATRRLKRHGTGVGFFLQFGYPGETREDIEKTIRMVEELRPDDIGISVSYPLPGTIFYERIKAEMGDKRNWTDSDDLALMFRGTYSPAYYRSLHRLVHGRFRMRQGMETLAELAAHPLRIDGKKIRRLAGAARSAITVALGGRQLRRLESKTVNTP